jgi:hypothetical protein
MHPSVFFLFFFSWMLPVIYFSMFTFLVGWDASATISFLDDIFHSIVFFNETDTL